MTVLPVQGEPAQTPAPAAEPPAAASPGDEHADEPVAFDLPPLKDILSRFATESEDPLANHEAGDQAAADSDPEDDMLLERARMLRITRMPAAVPIEETSVGRAFGQWILAVRCECGRRWFEVEPIYRAQCPRCGKVVYLEVDGDASMPDDPEAP